MRGVIDWAGLDILAELAGIDDMEILITELIAIRDYVEEKASENRRS